MARSVCIKENTERGWRVGTIITDQPENSEKHLTNEVKDHWIKIIEFDLEKVKQGVIVENKEQADNVLYFLHAEGYEWVKSGSCMVNKINTYPVKIKINKDSAVFWERYRLDNNTLSYQDCLLENKKAEIKEKLKSCGIYHSIDLSPNEIKQLQEEIRQLKDQINTDKANDQTDYYKKHCTEKDQIEFEDGEIVSKSVIKEAARQFMDSNYKLGDRIRNLDLAHEMAIVENKLFNAELKLKVEDEDYRVLQCENKALYKVIDKLVNRLKQKESW